MRIWGRIETAPRTLSGIPVACCGAIVRAKLWVDGGADRAFGLRQQDQPGRGAGAVPRAAARTPRRRPCAPARPTPASPVSTRRAAGTPPGRRGPRPICCARSARADQHGLDKSAFLGPIQQARSAGAHDAALSLAALTYAEALARGRTDPTRLSRPYTVPRPSPDLAAGLARRARRTARSPPGSRAWRRRTTIIARCPRPMSRRAARSRRRDGNPPASLLDRARTLAVNLERRRWLERTPPRDADRRQHRRRACSPIGATARPPTRRRVVVGEPGRETPELGAPMFRLVANPTWTVPRSIESEVSSPRRRCAATIWSGATAGSSSNRGRPTRSAWSSSTCANDQQIYLHDTPAKSLFRGTDRHASHGCVRVFDALGFAAMIAADEGVLDEWNRARATGEESFVPLPTRSRSACSTRPPMSTMAGS